MLNILSSIRPAVFQGLSCTLNGIRKALEYVRVTEGLPAFTKHDCLILSAKANIG